MTQKVLNIIWKDFHNSLLYYIRKRIKKSEDANDILQDVFFKIIKSDVEIKSTPELTSWIYKVTKNSIIDYWRKNKINIDKTTFLEFEPEEEKEESKSSEAETLAGCIDTMITNLPEKYSIVFNLYEKEKLSHKEISAKLEISISGSKTRLQRAREKLKEMLVNYCQVETDVYGNVINSCAEESSCNNCEDLK